MVIEVCCKVSSSISLLILKCTVNGTVFNFLIVNIAKQTIFILETLEKKCRHNSLCSRVYQLTKNISNIKYS